MKELGIFFTLRPSRRTIGLYVEEEPAGTSGYSMVFYNLNLEWLTDKL